MSWFSACADTVVVVTGSGTVTATGSGSGIMIDHSIENPLKNMFLGNLRFIIFKKNMRGTSKFLRNYRSSKCFTRKTSGTSIFFWEINLERELISHFVSGHFFMHLIFSLIGSKFEKFTEIPFLGNL